ncbi:MAG: PQQ-dependent sugar dehydrogenase [Pseudomonadota bacterium]|nr:PQQ-dependent sugar dehydrogenase [Pseudomonadota bacterium]
MRAVLLASCTALLLLAACNGNGDTLASGNGAAPGRATAAVAAAAETSAAAATSAPTAPGGRPFAVQEIGRFNEPWAIAFLSNRQALITEKPGRLLLWTAGGQPVPVQGVPKVDYGGQIGLGDVVLHPDFGRNRMVYLSWSEPGSGDTRGPVVGRARLMTEGSAPRLEGLQVIWRGDKVDGRFHHGHRIAFSGDGHMFITSGDRMKFQPAQDMNTNIGKIVRLREDGSVPRDNPFANRGGTAAQIWSLGHRNPLGIAFDGRGQLWSHEMGPRNGDEFNLIERGSNYGWPVVSNGQHYDGKDIPDHPTRPEFNAPEITWNGVSPAGMMIYSGRLFPQWRGNAFLGALTGRALVRVAMNGTTAREVERWDMGQRIREVEQGPDGAIYVLEDTRNGNGGRLLRLAPSR